MDLSGRDLTEIHLSAMLGPMSNQTPNSNPEGMIVEPVILPHGGIVYPLVGFADSTRNTLVQLRLHVHSERGEDHNLKC